MSEGWYPRYFQSNVTVLNNAARKKKSVKVKMIGLQGCLTYGVRTRFEWTALTEDINEGCEKGKIHVRPSSLATSGGSGRARGGVGVGG